MIRLIRITIMCLGALMLAASCSSAPRPILQARSNFAHNPPGPADIYASNIDGNKILFVADNQKAMIKTEPIFEQGYYSEKSLNTAHRRAALDAFSLDILEHILTTEDHALVIHAGDLLNNSCLQEYEDVERLLNGNKRPWFVAPGNHDGYYLGLSSPNAIRKGVFQFIGGLPAFLDERSGWARICTEVVERRKLGDPGIFNDGHYEKYEANVVDKTAFNGLYLKSLGVLDLKSRATRTELGKEPGREEYAGYYLYCLEFDPQRLHRGFMRNICWTEYEAGDTPGDHFNNFTYDGNSNELGWWEEKKPWLNFIVQKLEVRLHSKTVDIVIIDTSSYTNGVGIRQTGQWDIDTRGAADAGHLSPEQYNALLPWLGSGRETYLVGHHPVVDFDMESFERLHDMFDKDEYRIKKYVSGDTHDGYDVTFKWLHEDRPDNGYLVNESNLGATIDAPIEYAVLGQSYDETILKRISLTPLHETRIFKAAGSVKTRRIANVDLRKDYAFFKNDTWSGLCGFQNQWLFLQSDSPFDPFLQMSPGEQRQYRDEVKIPQTSEWFLIHYVLNPFTIMNIRRKSLEAYKINRLTHLVKVYEQLFEYAGIERSNKAIELTARYENALNKLKRTAFTAYSNEDAEPFNDVLYYLNLLLNELEKHDFSSSRAKSFRICSALYEAEREYHTGLIDD